MMICTDREAFIARTKKLSARLSRISQPALPPNMAWNQNTGKWEAPQPPRKSSLTNAIAWDDGDGDGDFGMDDGILTADYCTPSRHRSLTAQPQARPRAITYAQYDPAFDVDLPPELDVPVPAEPGIPVEWPTRIVQPVPLSARA